MPGTNSTNQRFDERAAARRTFEKIVGALCIGAGCSLLIVAWLWSR